MLRHIKRVTFTWTLATITLTFNFNFNFYHSSSMEDIFQCSACSVLLLTTSNFRTHVANCPARNKNVIRKVCHEGKVLFFSAKYPLVQLKRLTEQDISKHIKKEKRELECKIIQVERGPKPRINLFNCNVCFRRFPSEIAFFQHWRTDHTKSTNETTLSQTDENDVEIIQVQKASSLPMQSKLSSQNIKESNGFNCNICFSNFPSVNTFYLHWRTYHTLSNNTAPNYQPEVQIVEDDIEILPMNDVPKIPTIKKQPQISIKSVKSINEPIKNGYNCSVCPSSFSSMPLLYKHFTANHDQENLPFKCGQCTRRFKDKKERLDHVLQMHSIFHR